MNAAVGEEMGEEPMADPEAEYSPDAEHKATFQEMCKTIRKNDDEAAWAAYQKCKELDSGGGEELPMLGGELG